MADEEHLFLLKQRVEAWNEWRLAELETRPDLSGADLDGVDLREAVLYQANLSYANLSEANLSGVDLSGADLSEADLSGANLSEALIKSTNSVGTSFEGANVSDTVFADLDFSSCAGLDSVRHYGPSTLGFDSIIRSKGRIPAAFLRGVGAIVDWTC
jgi:uncharacterized protein YjbI with pentapeptide repeats